MNSNSPNIPLIHLAYVSTAVRFMPVDELTALLEQARQKNDRLGITGMLLYKDKSFLQVLEGEPDAVHELYQRIQRDDRHEKVKTLFDEALDTRDFPEWTMGFQNLDGTDLSELEGYSDFLETPDTARTFFEHQTRAKKLLLLFRANS